MTAAAAYLIAGDDPGLVLTELAALLERLTAAPGSGGLAPPVEEHGPTTGGKAGGSGRSSGPGDAAEGRGPDGDGAGRARIDLGPVLDACSTPPFLFDRRVVVLRHAGLLDAAQVKLVAAYLASPLETTTLVLVADEKAVPAALERAVRAAGEVLDTSVGSGSRARASWLDAHLKHAPVRLNAPARALLDDNLGEDLSRLPGLLASLAAAWGEGATVTPEELEPFLGEAGALKPWDLTDALDAGNGDKAVAVLHRMLGSGERHALVVLGTLHRHYGAMLRLDGSDATSDASAAELLKMKPFPAGKALRRSRALGHDNVATAVCMIADADLDLRGRTALPPDLVLEILVARLARLSRATGERAPQRRQPAGSRP
jgi:DNA polymerase-3 subunit delta